MEEVDAALLAAARAPGPGGTPLDPDRTLPDGTTAAWALLWGRELLVAWLGDSRAVLCRWSSPSVDRGTAACQHDAPAGWGNAACSQQGTAMAADSESVRCRADPTSSATPCMWGAARDRRLAAVALTEDHSPARPDERARILAAGGTVSSSSDGARQHDGHTRCAQRFRMSHGTWPTKGSCLALLRLTNPNSAMCCPLHCPCQASCIAYRPGTCVPNSQSSWINVCPIKCFHVPSHVWSGSRARLEGELAVSRALGDAPYRDSGLIAEPELAPWRVLEAADALLLLASDGLFETLPADEACRVALAVATGDHFRDAAYSSVDLLHATLQLCHYGTRARFAYLETQSCMFVRIWTCKDARCAQVQMHILIYALRRR